MRLTQFYHQGKTWLTDRQMTSTVIGAIVLLAMAVGNTSLIMALKWVGKTQSLELVAYDRVVSLLPDEPKDDRILIVGITDHYINKTGKINPSDQDLTTVIDKLSAQNPAAIGIDLYRNIPQEGRDAYLPDADQETLDPEQFPYWKALLECFQKPHIISITTFASENNVAIPPPPGAPPTQVGFNDLLLDADDVVRRGLLMGWSQNPETGENETFHFSLPMTLAMKYLENPPAASGIAEPILPGNAVDNPMNLTLGDATFIPLTSDAGGYDRSDAEGYQFFLNYHSRNVGVISEEEPSSGKPIGIEAISFLDVLRDNVPPEKIQDKIVLIGSTAATLKDVFATPYDNSEDPQFPGVFIHAQTISQILDAALGERSLIGFWPSWAENLWILGWALLGGTLAWRCRQIWLLNLAMMVMFGSLLFSFYGALRSSVWIPVAAPGLGALLTAGGMVGFRAQRAQQQRNMMQSLLGQSISPEIANELWRSRNDILKSGKLPGQKLTATILFSDIKGFSTLSEKQPPDELLDWLNEYLKEMIQAVVSHGGIVNKFTGDGMLAVFGVPVKRTEQEITADAQQAVRCALAMREGLDRLNRAWVQQKLPHVQEDIIQMRVGIFTGPVTAGSIGSKERLEYGVIGDSVNTASRLESCLKNRHENDCRILIATETMQHLITSELFQSQSFQDWTHTDGMVGYIPFNSRNPNRRHTQRGDTLDGEIDRGDRPYLEIESWGARVLKGKEHKVNIYRVIGTATESDVKQALESPQSPQSDRQPQQTITKNTPLITEPNHPEVDL